jgi:CHRD domain.
VPGDQLTNAHIHVGDPATSGPVLIPFNPTFTGSGASGRVTNLRQGQIDTLLAGPVYVNVHSTQVGSGIVRAQLDKINDFAVNVALNGFNERPDPVNTTATGQAILRLMTDKTLYSKITVTDLEGNDTLTVAHVHRGDANTAGPVRITLFSGNDDFGVVKSQVLMDSLVNILKNDPCYVNAHSRLHGPGIIRGQIR